MTTLSAGLLDLDHAPRRATEAIWIVLSALATFLIVGTVVTITSYLFWHGAKGFSPAFILGGISEGMFDVDKSGVFPMVLGTLALVLLMTVFVAPLGIVTAIYLHEYASQESRFTRFVRMAINNLAGIPSIVFGLFGLGFFVRFVGSGIDSLNHTADPVWGKPALIWGALTMALLTLPVVVVATEEALRAVPQSLRDASLGLGATKLYTITRIVVPQAMSGILTGCILAVSRGAGEVAPILFVGAAYLAPPPYALDRQFMELGYHIYVLATQSPNIDQTTPLLFATVVVLLLLTFCLNILAIAARFMLRARYRNLSTH